MTNRGAQKLKEQRLVTEGAGCRTHAIPAPSHFENCSWGILNVCETGKIPPRTHHPARATIHSEFCLTTSHGSFHLSVIQEIPLKFKKHLKKAEYGNIIPALGRQKQTDLLVQGQPCMQSKFQDSQRC